METMLPRYLTSESDYAQPELTLRDVLTLGDVRGAGVYANSPQGKRAFL
ncbi:hypothetical protein CA54_44250 [Symmachiella macrocystis]|uniref:Uncharacterized protein n=1 Tax=Symmachiella macrocystis TaxID=2527985 RepID=A0A5C6BA79_9PLAN|nr:hypothetical protein CA54_44250 [Symmachiella macrocystis]